MSSVRQFPAAGADPLFHDCVHVRYAYAGHHDVDSGLDEDVVKEGGKLFAPVSEEVTDFGAAEALPGQGEGFEEVAGQDRLNLWRKNAAQVVEERWGAAPMSASFWFSQTLEATTFAPSTASSLWMRR